MKISIENKLDRALQRRGHLLEGGETDALRLVDGAGDGLPGFAMEGYAGRWLAVTSKRAIDDEIRVWLKKTGRCVFWKRLDQKQRESPLLLFEGRGDQADPFLVRENGLNFEVSFRSGYSQGIFLDQRLNRAEVMRRMGTGDTLLNLFSYTGAFSVAGASQGAETTSLDLSAPYLEWTRRNLRHNGIDDGAHHFCKGDAFHWLRRFAKQGRRFDGVILDPPTFSRDARGKVFQVEKDYGELAGLAKKVLAKDGWMLCCTNFRGLSVVEFEGLIGFENMESRVMPEEYRGDEYLKSVWVG